MSTVKARIGLFGGSFNPVHIGHVNIAKTAIKELKLDELIFIPCYRSVGKDKSQYVSSLHRINMLISILPENCSISTYEIEKRAEVETIETLRYFRELFKEAELFFIMGSDNLETIETWQEYNKLDEYANLVVFKRKGSNVKSTKGLKIRYVDNELWNYSSRKIRSNSLEGLDNRVEIYIRENKLYGYVG